MRGQWVGFLEGHTPGTTFVNIDDRNGFFSGSAYFAPQEQGVPATFARFRTADNGPSHKVVATIEPVHPHGGRPLSADELQRLFPNVMHASKANITLELVEGALKVGFATDIGTSARGTLHLTSAPSSYRLLRMIEQCRSKPFKR